MIRIVDIIYSLHLFFFIQIMAPPDKNKQRYTPDMVQAAIEDVRLHNMTIRGSAKLHNVSVSTRRRRLQDPREAHVVIAVPTKFSFTEEAQLAEHSVRMADMIRLHEMANNRACT